MIELHPIQVQIESTKPFIIQLWNRRYSQMCQNCSAIFQRLLLLYLNGQVQLQEHRPPTISSINMLIAKQLSICYVHLPSGQKQPYVQQLEQLYSGLEHVLRQGEPHSLQIWLAGHLPRAGTDNGTNNFVAFLDRQSKTLVLQCNLVCIACKVSLLPLHTITYIVLFIFSLFILIFPCFYLPMALEILPVQCVFLVYQTPLIAVSNLTTTQNLTIQK